MADSDDAFHEGEQLVQTRVGVRGRMAQVGPRVIREFMPEQHRELFETLPYVFVGTLDGGQPLASVLIGAPGFVVTPDERTMVIAAPPIAGDALRERLANGGPIGVLGIELHTRRRNRMNGRVRAVRGDAVAIEVDQSFGNCPQYIQTRAPVALVSGEASPSVSREAPALSDEAIAIVRRADTFFIASASAHAESVTRREGVDVSHRGGKPGFVRAEAHSAATVLTVPDFAGNQFFNTLGNLVVRPRAGLLFIDFASGDVLQLAASAEVIFEGPELAAFIGAQRLLRFTVSGGVLSRAAVPLRWSPAQHAPQLATTGSWEEVARALAK